MQGNGPYLQALKLNEGIVGVVVKSYTQIVINSMLDLHTIKEG